MKYRILWLLAVAFGRHPGQRVGQILANAIEQHSAANVRNDLYYLGDDLIVHALEQYNKEEK